MAIFALLSKFQQLAKQTDSLTHHVKRTNQAAFPTDRICHFGDGLFETIAIRGSQPCLWHSHLDRLQKGCQQLALPPVDEKALTADVQHTCADHAWAVLKIIVSAGFVNQGYQRTAPVIPSYYLQCRPWPESAFYQADIEANLQLCQTRLGSQPQLAGIKHLNRLEQVLGRNELQPGFTEGIMLNQSGDVVEGTMSNLLIKHTGRYITPPIDDCGIAGVVRHLMLQQAVVFDVRVDIARVSLKMLQQADAVYIMNSLLGVRRVAEFEGHQYPKTPMPDFLQEVSRLSFNPFK